MWGQNECLSLIQKKYFSQRKKYFHNICETPCFCIHFLVLIKWLSQKQYLFIVSEYFLLFKSIFLVNIKNISYRGKTGGIFPHKTHFHFYNDAAGYTYIYQYQKSVLTFILFTLLDKLSEE